jgi:hypothetical protein
MKVTKDLLSGLAFLAFGLLGVGIGSRYQIGTPSRMGPGYFPVVVAGLIALIGAVMIANAARDPESSEPVEGWDLRAYIFVIAGIVAFTLLISSLGLLAAIAALTVLSSFARNGVRPLELVILVVVLSAIAFVIFVYGLGVPLKVLPR